MNYFKRITSFLLTVVILLTHFVVLFHTLEHKENHQDHSSETIEFNKSSDISEDCSVCDIYTNIHFSDHKVLSYIFIEPNYVQNEILQQENQFIALVLYLKKSRSPPNYTV